jgi:hypothetical protein
MAAIRGVNPKTERAIAFWYDLRYWQPLWIYCCAVAPTVTIAARSALGGAAMDSFTAQALASVLRAEIDSGRAAEYTAAHTRMTDELPVAIRPPLSLASIVDFAEFLDESGGFGVW